MEPNDYAALIEGHALFKHGAATLRPNLKAVKSAHRRDRHLGVLAYHPALGLVVTDSEALRLLPISKTTISNFKKDSFQDLKPVPGFRSDIHAISFNHEGTLLALQNRSKVAVINLNSTVKAELAKGAKAVNVKLVHLGENDVRLNGSAEVLQCAWHPLSNCHLLVLYSDKTLRLYNVNTNPSEAEQVFPLMNDRVRSTSIPSAFSCGNTRVQGSFNSMTVYVLFNTGEIFGLCPVLPFNALVPKSLIVSLYSPSSKLWLNEVTTLTSEREDSSSKSKKSASKGKSKLSASFSMSAADSSSDEDTNATDSDGEGHRHDPNGDVVRTRPPRGFEQEVVVLQGPLNTLSPNDKNIFWSDINCLSSVPPAIVAARNDGLIDIWLAMEHIAPRWATASRLKLEDSGIPLQSLPHVNLGVPLLMEGEGNGLDLLSSSTSIEFAGPRFIRDESRPEQLFVAHRCGIHLVNLPALPILTAISLGERPSVSEIPASSCDAVLNTNPLSASLADPLVARSISLGHVLAKFDSQRTALLSLSTEGSLFAMNILTPTPTAKPPSASSTSSSSTSSSAAVQTTLTVQLPPSLHVKGFPNSAHVFHSREALEFFQATKAKIENRVNTLQKNHKCVEEVKARQREAHAVQSAKLVEAAELYATICQRQADIESHLAKVAAAHENLRLRTYSLFASLSVGTKLTDAEKEFAKELTERESDLLLKYVPAFNKLKESLGHQSKKLALSSLSAQNETQLRDKLSAQEDQLDNLKGRFAKIADHLEHII